MLSAYAALKDVDQTTANQHIDKGFQYALAKWWQVSQHVTELQPRETARVINQLRALEMCQWQSYAHYHAILHPIWTLQGCRASMFEPRVSVGVLHSV